MLPRALSTYTQEELRHFFARTHYRRTAKFPKNRFLQSRKELESMQQTLQRLQGQSSVNAAGKSDMRLLKALSRFESAFRAAMDDDLDTTRALKLLSEFLRLVRSDIKSGKQFASNTCDAAVRRIRASYPYLLPSRAMLVAAPE